MKAFISNKLTLSFIGLLLIIAIWFIISASIPQSVMIFPNPYITIKETISILSRKYVYKCIGSTLLRMIIGFLISFVSALIFGSLGGNYSFIKQLLSPAISLFKSIPTASLVFLFLVLVGVRKAPIILVILISFPILYESVVGGIENTDKTIIKASRVDGANRFMCLLKIQIPLSIPYIVVGIASSFSLSFKIEIMSEILTGDTGYGLGTAILVSRRADPTNLTTMFAYSLIAIIIIYLISILAYFVKKRFVIESK